MINIKDLRKTIFINSTDCNYYIDQNKTVAAGFMRTNGYKYNERFSDEKIEALDKLTRKFSTIMNCAVGLEILLYIYCVFIPFFEQFLKMQYAIAALVFAIPPLVALFLTYVVINKFYEKELDKFGAYQIVKFKPNIYNVEPKAFEKYLNTKRKSWFVLLLVLLIFLFVVVTPSFIANANKNEKFDSAIKMANVYLKVVPINSGVFAQRAYAQYKTQKYENAIKDYTKANTYSNSDSYDYDILGAKVLLLPYAQAKAEFDKLLENSEDLGDKHFLSYEKAILLQKNGDLKGALDIYNELVNEYYQSRDKGFPADSVFYFRSVIKNSLGDKDGAALDNKIARNMCPECEFKLEFNLVNLP